MSMNKQTVWLVTMLTLMVVLSAYYIVTGPVEPAEQGNKEAAEKVDADVKTKSGVGEPSEEAVKEAGDYFVGYQMERQALRSKLSSEYMEKITDPAASEEQIDEAQAKLNELMEVDNTETVLEELIREEGYQDAVVINNDAHVNVIVQSDQLKSAQVVKLVTLTKKQMGVAANQVSVTYRP
ncbi:SpoIIIAH-like family protein [Mechercharimyces sp. CAU 1602]|uniref:SpoIIIAH-like family protein n=1 Tax=Mechercharimyces sp. CAU 1602 TaxID=2973933 RepID=UPI0021621199|nr:SpoIIIAH-like family protein [Mechercharimyces sp. CAU 1602]MCS1350778.1 SpoIIIAH-like family protein [Mechercharimyces sp. CAU 1602]